MPNHVDNDLYIYGKAEILKEFMESSKEGNKVLSADKFIPYPEAFKILDDKANEARNKIPPEFIQDGFNSGGYQWCLNNWGTKWGIYNSVIKTEKLDGRNTRLVYKFQTAWSPPLPIILAMSNKFPSLKFKLNYFECGMQFKGTYVVKASKIIKDIESKYTGNRGG